MSVEYEQARDIARRHTEPEWNFGIYCLDDRRIVENDSYYVFRVGARDYIVDGDSSYAMAGATPVVYKEDGSLKWLTGPEVGMDSTLQLRENPARRIEI